MSLRNALETKRNQLKLYETNYHPRRPSVCSNETLRLIERYKPHTLEELKKIYGVGEAFINNYGNDFLSVIEEFDFEEKNEMENREIKVMEKLKNRLVCINSRNRMLYNGKLNKTKGVDLYKFSKNLTEFKEIIFSETNKKHLLFEIEYNDDSDIKNESIYKNIVSLKREQEQIETETGINELYIAYPFVQGKLEDDDFLIKAPLVLFPCKLEREDHSFYIQRDLDRDIIYNTTLLLANNKARGVNLVLPDNVIDELDEEHFFEAIRNFYEDHNFYIKKINKGDKKYLENKKDEFPKYKNGELEINEYMVLGTYSDYMTSMHKDFQTMIDTGESTDLIKWLLSNINEFGVETDEEHEHSVIENNLDQLNNEKDVDVSLEKNIVYINELNYSQEKVLEKIQNTNALVVQGPPGTGKSQTITSLISQFVLEGKKVLMVSEKKAALDVIYSRLGKISEYSMFIDDTENKEEFYRQMRNIIDLSQQNNFSTSIEMSKEKEHYDLMIKATEERIIKLQDIARKIFLPNSFGVAMNKLYNENISYNFSNELDLKMYEYLKDNLNNNLKVMNYSIIKNNVEKFSSLELLNSLDFYYNNINNYNWVSDLKLDLSDYELNTLINKLANLKENIGAYVALPWFKKIKYRKQLYINVMSTFENVFIDRKLIKGIFNTLFDRFADVEYFFQNYNKFIEGKIKKDTLTLNEVFWYKEIYNLSQHFIELPQSEANKQIYQHLLYVQIENFQRENGLTINNVNNFEQIIKDLETAIHNKRVLTKSLLLTKLKNSIKSLNENHKINNMMQRSKRVRNNSVNKFINDFKFELFDSIPIWLMTPEVVSDILPLKKGIFDLVIFDEASQMYVERGIPSIYRANKVVVAGDTQQLKPSSLGMGRVIEEDEEDLEEYSGAVEEESLLALAQYRYQKTMLNYHYRSTYEELINFSNYGFYGGKLYVSPNLTDSDERPIEWIKVKNGKWIDKQNIEEAKKIVELVKKILKERKDETLGIITFNVTQKNLIMDFLDEARNKDERFDLLLSEAETREKDGENIGFFVKNIENVQGDQRDIIIFSIGYAKNATDRVSINFGWLSQNGGENRLNVAISRAKKKIYVVSSIEPEELAVDNSQNKGPKLFKEYLKYAKAVSQNNPEVIRTILLSLLDGTQREEQLSFDSEFEEEVCNMLTEKGYRVSTQVGVGGYRIDMAIVDQNTGDYILGIECDGKLYHSSSSARERDYHRQKYLESRGWKIHRIWSPNWWKDPNKEIQKIETKLRVFTPQNNN